MTRRHDEAEQLPGDESANHPDLPIADPPHGRPPHADHDLPSVPKPIDPLAPTTLPADDPAKPKKIGIGDLPNVQYLDTEHFNRQYDFVYGGVRYEHHGEDAEGVWLYRHNG